MKISTEYQGRMRFAHGDGTARVVMDGKPEVGGQGEALTPKEMVLQGLAGCTGLDVASMLEKQRVPFQLSIDAEAEQTNAHPKVFKTIKIVYHVRAKPEDRPKVERAIELSETRFCGVSAMLKQGAALSWELDFQPLET